MDPWFPRLASERSESLPPRYCNGYTELHDEVALGKALIYSRNLLYIYIEQNWGPGGGRYCAKMKGWMGEVMW